MGRHERGRGAVRAAVPTVRRAPDDAAGAAPAPEPDAIRKGETLSAGCEAAEPEHYGVRVDWQPEAVRIEAAEFLLATRTEHEARLRATHDLDRRLHHDD